MTHCSPFECECMRMEGGCPSDLMVMCGESEACRDKMDQRSHSQGTHLGEQFLFEMMMYHILTLGALDVAKAHC